MGVPSRRNPAPNTIASLEAGAPDAPFDNAPLEIEFPGLGETSAEQGKQEPAAANPPGAPPQAEIPTASTKTAKGKT